MTDLTLLLLVDEPFWQKKEIFHKNGKFGISAIFGILASLEFTVEDLFKLGHVFVMRDGNGIVTELQWKDYR